MSYCHCVQDNLYHYAKKLDGEEEHIDTISFALLQNQLKTDLEDCYCHYLARKGEQRGLDIEVNKIGSVRMIASPGSCSVLL